MKVLKNPRKEIRAFYSVWVFLKITIFHKQITLIVKCKSDPSFSKSQSYKSRSFQSLFFMANSGWSPKARKQWPNLTNYPPPHWLKGSPTPYSTVIEQQENSRKGCPHFASLGSISPYPHHHHCGSTVTARSLLYRRLQRKDLEHQ